MAAGRRAIPVVLAGGGLLSLAFPEPSLAFLAWFAVVPLLWVLDGAGLRRGFLLGFTFGVGFFGLLLHWVSIIGVVAWIALVVLQAVFIGVFGALWGRSSLRATVWQRVVVPALMWVGLVEYMRSIVPVRGFTWGQLAQAHNEAEWLLRLAGLAGGWLVAGVVVAANALVYEGLRRIESPRTTLRFLAGAALILMLPWVLPASGPGGETITVAIVQGNVPDLEPSYEKDQMILASHVDLTIGLPEVDLVVWPESAVAADPFRDESFALGIADAARAVGAPMIVGGNIDRDDGKYQVMAFLVSPDGEIVDRYQKTHLVPFGEYVPARRFLDWIPALDQVPRDAVPGDEVVVFDVEGRAIAPVISFEGDFGPLVRDRIDAGGRMLVVATNTSTWEGSWASAQHVAMSEVRAAENGVQVVHAAISGISAFISPSGEVTSQTEMWEPAVLIEEIAVADDVSLYAKTGDWLPKVALVLGLWFFYRLSPAFFRRTRVI